jgi:hypothetical protein
VTTGAPRHRSRIEKARYGSVYVVGKVRLSPSVESDRGTGAGGTRRLPREPVPEGSSTPDLGDGGGRPEQGYDADTGPAA